MATVARAVGERLRDAGVRRVFGHPGGEIVDLIEGFRQAGLEFVLTKHETAAAFMAEATATLTGTVGVCMATLGPGATNLVTGIAHAYLDRGPVLALTGQLPADRYEIATHQRLDLRALFAPITKWQATLTAANAPTVVERALRTARRPRRGPVYLEVPSDVPHQEISDVPIRRVTGRPITAIDEEAVRAAAARLRESERPLLLVGMDANDESVAGPLRRLAEGWSVPVMVGPKAKGIFREDHPLFVGTIEGLGTGHLFDYVDRCDLVVMIGFDPVEFDRDWTAKARVVHIGPLPNDDRYYGSEVEIVGPIDIALQRLRAASAALPKVARDDVRAFRDAFQRRLRPTSDRLTPQQVVDELRQALPEDALVATDVGYNKAVMSQCWPAYRPRGFFVSNGLSSMGYGLPAALALKQADPARRVACVVGDGGFAMSMAELETGVRHGLGVLVVVLVDDALSQIKAGQERKGYPVTGTTFGALDYAKLAAAFSVTAVDVRTVAECRDAFRARPAERPTLVAAHVDPSAYAVKTD
ncbi:MAG TPA: thiamine pyrophosphate-binding protein [Candidatus Limnocylindria bacterium]|jgi:acetolactate synthase-1/2/3 large subunit|nr:thiamine pyrophosphate-binding protein [Candidatus Limnocylindria bacterium]